MKRLILLALFALTLIAGSLPGVAAAAPRASTGAHVVDLAISHWEEDGSRSDFTLTGVSTETLTPKGNQIWTANLDSTSAFYDADGTLLATGEGTQHQVRVVKDPSSGDFDNFHIVSDRLSETTTLADGTVCTSSFTLHYANGQVQILDFERVCQ